jgi:hypothetical protein
MDHQQVDPQSTSTSTPNDITDPIVASQIELLIQQYVRYIFINHITRNPYQSPQLYLNTFQKIVVILIIMI